jgi:hypothetical protein
MKFFIPRVGPDSTEVFYLGLRTGLAHAFGFRLTDRRIQQLSYTSKGQRQDAVVGKQLRNELETVYAIFESSEAYLILTPQHGITGQLPLQIKPKDVVEVTDFDAAEAKQPA